MTIVKLPEGCILDENGNPIKGHSLLMGWCSCLMYRPTLIPNQHPNPNQNQNRSRPAPAGQMTYHG